MDRRPLLFSTILFDLDGTLLDTSPGIFATANLTMHELGQESIAPNRLRTFVGPPLPDCFRIAGQLPEEQVSLACEIFQKRYAEGGMFEASVYKGMREVLTELKARGCSLGVATLKHEGVARVILEHFGICPHLETLVGSDDSGHMTKGDIIKRALDRMGVTDLSTVVMVGDTPHDQKGAKDAGVAFIGVEYGFGFPQGQALPEGDGVLGMARTPFEILALLDS
jgi:phosphoglycolate phosphatase